MNNWLLLDVNYLAYRALHSTGKLSFQDNPTGVLYGVISEAVRCMERFQTRQVCWCFDYGKPKRLQALPTYKATRKTKRKEATAEEKQTHREMKFQLHALRTEVLPELGFRNVFAAAGFEADDVIASLVNSIPDPHRSIMVSSDEDLYQLLGNRCVLWNPHKQQIVNDTSFFNDYGISCRSWPVVKALAGCSSDDVPGLSGVGEKTAIKYLRAELKHGTKTADKFDDAEEVLKRNLPLVSLPYEGCPVFKRKRDKVTRATWTAVMERYGFHSLIRSAPVGPSLRC